MPAHRLLPLVVLAAVVGAPAPAPLPAQSCTACHGDAALMATLAGDSARGEALRVDPLAYDSSVHGSLGFACTACHAGVGDYPHGPVTPVECGRCHGGEDRVWALSVHGRLDPRVGEVPARCWDCHGAHDVAPVAEARSPVYRMTLYRTCATCHSDPVRMARFGQANVEPVETYLHSVHGRGLLEKGLAVAPTCTDCHGPGGDAHGIDVVGSRGSPMHRRHVVETCGRCHTGIRSRYREGIHGEAYFAGNADVPTCVDCHHEHAIQPITSPESGVYPTHIAQTCTACHDREELNARYGLPPARRSTYLGSFHGIALVNGVLTVANCESCHGAHGILPSGDPRSPVHRENLVGTCGRCHPGIGSGVAEGKIHVASVRADINLAAYLIQWFYYLLIGGTVIFALTMIFLDQYRYRVVEGRERRRRRV